MKLKKGLVLMFKDREEVIMKSSNNRINGMIVTDKNKYSVDFIIRWLEFGFIRIKGV